MGKLISGRGAFRSAVRNRRGKLGPGNIGRRNITDREVRTGWRERLVSNEKGKKTR